MCMRLTGQVKSNFIAMGFENPFWVSVVGFGPTSDVITSPNVQGDVQSILTWYSFKQILNRGLHTPSHSEFDSIFPVQHFPTSSLPASLSNDNSRNSKTPDDSAWERISRFKRLALVLFQFVRYFKRMVKFRLR